MRVASFLTLAVYWLTTSCVTALKCGYDLSDPESCAIIDADDAGCPALCLHGDDMTGTCTDCGASCTYGAYGQCSWTQDSVTREAFVGTPESSAFSFSFVGRSSVYTCGSHSEPARVFAVSGAPTCIVDSNIVIAQVGCDMVARFAPSDRSDCDESTYVLDGCMCGDFVSGSNSQRRRSVWIGATVAYDGVSGTLVMKASTLDDHAEGTKDYARTIYMDRNATNVPRMWKPYQFTVCNDLTLDRGWCGTLTKFCFSSGVNSSGDCEISALSLHDYVADQRFSHGCAISVDRVIDEKVYREFDGIGDAVFTERPQAPWETEYYDDGFPLGALVVIVPVCCFTILACMAYLLLVKRCFKS